MQYTFAGPQCQDALLLTVRIVKVYGVDSTYNFLWDTGWLLFFYHGGLIRGLGKEADE